MATEPETIERSRIELKFWEGKGELEALAGACDSWWDKIQEYLRWINGQIDADTAPLELVNLLAWQRDIDRFEGEPETLYRKRVKYALANAKDAGCVAGFTRIWERLGLGVVGQNERISEVDWDVIELLISDQLLSENEELLNTIIRQYGRTCRRYSYSVMKAIGLKLRSFSWEHYDMASYAKEDIKMETSTRMRPFDFNNISYLSVAKES